MSQNANPAGSRPVSPSPMVTDRSKMPLSPHLQVWRFTVTMAASITHRATGIALYSGTLLLALWAFGVSQGPSFFWRIGGFLTSPIGSLIIFGYIWAMCFHLLGGLRYLYTDTGRGLVPETSKRIAWAVYIGSFVLAALIAFSAASARSGI